VRASHDLTRVAVRFDEACLMPNAGLLPAAALAQRVGLAGLAMYPEDVDDLAGTPAIPSVATHPPELIKSAQPRSIAPTSNSPVNTSTSDRASCRSSTGSGGRKEALPVMRQGCLPRRWALILRGRLRIVCSAGESGPTCTTARAVAHVGPRLAALGVGKRNMRGPLMLAAWPM
jgi:hypothetical protein